MFAYSLMIESVNGLLYITAHINKFHFVWFFTYAHSIKIDKKPKLIYKLDSEA